METSENNEGMELVICQPRELADEIPVFLSAQTCRAIQTAFPVNSFEVPEICPVFPFSGNIKHICIPMIINREAIGVVSFLFEQTLNDKIALETEPISDTILHAVNYLNEALPLIQAKRYAHRLKTMALKDQLTGLFNRRYLDNSLDMLVAGAKRRESSIGLLMCDIDYFKQVNDQYGHDAGDAVLKQLANLLRTSVRASDIVVRFGGEEFLVLLNDCNDKEMEIRIAEKIRAAVAEHTFRFQEAAIKKTVSIGTSRFPYEGAKGIWEAIKFADIALYKAKELGRNRVVQFDHSL
jgi:diguanylate cyclase (GGDEF)-like protein